MTLDRRAEALATLQALGVVVTHGQDVAALRAAIRRRDAHRRPLVFGAVNQCAGKLQHSTKDKAIKAARRIENPDVHPYRCVHCGWWHNGNTPKGAAS